ncbi:hypothetical protein YASMINEVIRUS_1500 [Yasminevirus sp. GU-2018]|uniref:AAA+ ATPase domain-containing protein n=1 Tax=Yasminevirus sp. GU-2018 TaxID=2420051 RepID=A0A5K0UAC5_9VIRU|nr:hypothetical protein YASMINEVIRUS_1500 [Yasminevirus sp. GU-2018]
MSFERLNCPDNTYAFKNCVLLNIPLFLSQKDQVTFSPKKAYCAKVGKFYYNIEHNPSLTNLQIMMSMYQRRDTSIDDLKTLAVFPLTDVIASCEKLPRVSAELTLHSDKKTIVNIEKDAFSKMLRDHLIDTKSIVSDQQHIVFKNVDGTTLVIKFITNRKTPGVVTGDTSIILHEGSPNISIAENKALFKTSLNLVDMGIGGLDDEFSEMFRRAFSSRMLKPETVKSLGIKHIKGILLHGPPGCGKTLIARKICKMIDSVEPKIVNGPDIKSKYVGESEANMRRLFADAEDEYKRKGDASRLHVIVFDEIDSICKARGTTTGGTGVDDSIVNQLLTKFDGVNECNNFLIIGMTNRPDMLDEALLRPGRFELQLQISLPDESGRLQIIKIHTKKLHDTNRMDPSVNIDELAIKTRNYTGAEIEGLVNSARSYAIQRAVKMDSEKEAIEVDEEKILVSKQDFDLALLEIKPRYGLDVSVKDQMSPYGIMMYSEQFEDFYTELKADILRFMVSFNKQMVCFVIGRQGSGRTNLALEMATITKYPFVKYVTGRSFVGMSEAQKSSHVKNCLDDADKSPQSVVILDDVENIIDWVYSDITGVPRFSLSVCSTLKSLLNYHHSNKRLVIFTFNDDTISTINSLRILPKSNRDYLIPESPIDPKIQPLIRGVNETLSTDIAQKDVVISDSDKAEKTHSVKVEKDESVLYVNGDLPIKQYIFEYNNAARF